VLCLYVDLQVKLASWAEAVLFEVETLHYSDKSTTPGAGAGTRTVCAREDTQQVAR
jgi:hypothetical protein